MSDSAPFENLKGRTERFVQTVDRFVPRRDLRVRRSPAQWADLE